MSERLVPATLEARKAQRAIHFVATVALAAIALGLVMQLLVVVARVLAGGPMPGASFVADLAGGVVWSTLVCTGVAIGVSLGNARAALAGLFGLVFAPVGLAAAKGTQKLVLALTEASSAPALLSLEVVGLVRAVEYGVLAFALVMLTERRLVKALPYLGVGAAVGVVFGGALVGLTFAAQMLNGAAPSLPALAATAMNEIGSPVGCAVLIYIGQLVTHNFGVFSRQSAPMEGMA